MIKPILLLLLSKKESEKVYGVNDEDSWRR